MWTTVQNHTQHIASKSVPLFILPTLLNYAILYHYASHEKPSLFSSTLTTVCSVFTEDILTNLNREHLPVPHPSHTNKKERYYLIETEYLCTYKRNVNWRKYSETQIKTTSKNRRGTCSQKSQCFIENTFEINLCKHCLNVLLSLQHRQQSLHEVIEGH